MALFDFLKQPDIGEGVAQFAKTPGAVLLDVRTRQEYAQGRIPASQNIPLDEIEQAAEIFTDRDTPLFVYCYSGARSSQASAALRRMGYRQVTNIGGFSGYRGKVEC